jgi:hypothetical protein
MFSSTSPWTIFTKQSQFVNEVPECGRNFRPLTTDSHLNKITETPEELIVSTSLAI